MRRAVILSLGFAALLTAGTAFAAENFVPANREAGAAPSAESKKGRKVREGLGFKSEFADKEWERSGLKQFSSGLKASLTQNPITGFSDFFKKQGDRYQERKTAGSAKAA